MDKSSVNEHLYFIGVSQEDISSHVKTMYVRRGITKGLSLVDKRWNLHIIIDEKTTIDELKNIWWKISQSRDKLIEYQGSDPETYSTILLEYINNQIISTPHYSSILCEMNFYSLIYLMWSIENSATKEYRVRGADLFRKLLRTFQIKDEDINHWESLGTNALRNNDLPWGLLNGPISKRRVNDTLRRYKRKLEKKSIVISPLLDMEGIFRINFPSIVHGSWQRVEKLLKKKAPKQFNVYEHEINGLYNEVCTVIRLSDYELEDLREISLTH